MAIFAQYLIPYIIVSIIYFSCDYFATSLGHITFNAVLKYLDEKKLSFLCLDLGTIFGVSRL